MVFLSNNFYMKDLSVDNVILGIKITRTPDEISLSQPLYMDNMIERFKEYGIKENTNPFLSHIHLHKNRWNEKWQSILKSSKV